MRLWCSHADHRQAERNRDPPVGKSPNQILGGDRELVLIAMLTAISLAFSLGSWWGIGLSVVFWVGAVAVLATHGEGRPAAPANICPAHPVQGVLSAKSGLLSRCVPIPRNWR